MSDQRNAVSRTHRLKPILLQFIDAFSETYGISKSAVVNLALFNLKEMLESAGAEEAHKGARIGMALGMKAKQFDH